jgi:hypothetical protein
MSLLPLSRSCRDACRSLPAQFNDVQSQILSLYEQHGVDAAPQLDVECALFVHWCTEIGLRNADGGLIDRWVARRRLEKSLRTLDRQLPQLAPMLAGNSVVLYRQRYREALYRIHNIYVRRSRTGGMEIPLTQRLSKHFLHYTAEPGTPQSPRLAEDLHRLLCSFFERQVAGILFRAS